MFARAGSPTRLATSAICNPAPIRTLLIWWNFKPPLKVTHHCSDRCSDGSIAVERFAAVSGVIKPKENSSPGEEQHAQSQCAEARSTRGALLGLRPARGNAALPPPPVAGAARAEGSHRALRARRNVCVGAFDRASVRWGVVARRAVCRGLRCLGIRLLRLR